MGVYEVGFCGFYLICEFKLLGIELYVVNVVDVFLIYKDWLFKDDFCDVW